MSDEMDRREKDEKEEKGDDGWSGEKWSGEKWSGDPLGRFTWALIIVWAGVVFLLQNLGGDDGVLGLDWDNVWSWILAGAGVLIWLEVCLRLVMPAYRRPLGGRMMLGTILLVLGLGGIADVELWPLIIIAIGVSMLVGYFTGPRRF